MSSIPKNRARLRPPRGGRFDRELPIPHSRLMNVLGAVTLSPRSAGDRGKSMSDMVRLPVGFFTANGGLFRYEELEAHPVAHYVEEDPPSATTARSALRLKQDLYESAGDRPFVVHSVLEHRDHKRTVVGRVERFGSLAEVMLHYPSLARSAGYMVRSPEGTGESSRRAREGSGHPDEAPSSVAAVEP